MEGQEVTPPVVLSEAACRAAQSKDYGLGATLPCHPERSEGSFAALRMTQVVRAQMMRSSICAGVEAFRRCLNTFIFSEPCGLPGLITAPAARLRFRYAASA
jgi:hypothetical protein